MIDQPPVLDPLEYRRTMGLFATGVTVLLVRTLDGEPIAMTANSLTSVSLQPLLLLVCVSKDAHIAPHLLAANMFSLSILCEADAALSDYFAGIYQQPEPPEFTLVEWEGGLRLGAAMGALGCRRYRVDEGGDHWIVLGEVTNLYRQENPRRPLVFYRGKYRYLKPREQEHL